MNYRKKTLEEIPEENTPVWTCTSEDCNGWMRDNFTFDYSPACPLCSSEMVMGMRMLPQLSNPSSDQRSSAKKA
ncbi:cold-shock protein [uncultured Paenibacillus sp.]|uniref:cold-shock protein n=1 Tax=uncultured Paenibacillus sp. TaxID=227322 RepID=UPI0015B2D1B1|nr:cold-shock protein [uncultured Paenibacillus sp.]